MTHTSTVRDHIIKALKTLGKPSTPSEIADAAGQVPGSVTSDLSKALNDPQQFSPVKRVGKADEHLYDLTRWAHTQTSPTADQLSIEDELTLEDELVTFLLNLPEIIQAETSEIEVIQAFAAQAADPQRLLKYRPSDLRRPLYRALDRAAEKNGKPILTYKSTDSYETLVRHTLNFGFLDEIAHWTDTQLEGAFAQYHKLQPVDSVSPDAPKMYQGHDGSLHVLTLPRKTVKQGDIQIIRDATGTGVPVTVHVLGTLTPDAMRAATGLGVTVRAANATWSDFNNIGFEATAWD